MVLNNFLNKAYRNVNITLNSFNNLKVVTKLFVIFLILLVMCNILTSLNNKNEHNILENFDTDKRYIIKIDSEIYDEFYSKKYDYIYSDVQRHNLEFKLINALFKKDINTRILDVGCGTGYSVKLFDNNNYDIIGLDKSSHMISKAKLNYPKLEFVNSDILNIFDDGIFDYESFSHILCLGKTIYEIKDKDSFFDNCSSLLSNDGYLIIHLVDRENFIPFVYDKNDKSKILYNPGDYGKETNRRIVKFNKNNELTSTYKKKINSGNTNSVYNDITPYATYTDKFVNFKLNKTRVNELNLYMPTILKIMNLAESKNFKLFKRLELKPAGYSKEYLFVFNKE